MIALLLSCQPNVDSPLAEPGSGCTLDAAPTNDSQEATNQVVWELSGEAQTVEAVASWYGGGVIARTVFDVHVADAIGRVAYLPFATDLNLQDEHGDTFTLQLRALDAEGNEQCRWEDSLPFFAMDSGNHHSYPVLTQLLWSSRADFDASLMDRYLLHPQEIPQPGIGGSALLVTALGDVVGWYDVDDDLWDSTEMEDNSSKQIADVTLNNGNVHLLTTGYPDLVQSAYCSFAAATGRPLQCSSTGQHYHHSLFLSDSGESAFTSQWKDTAEEGNIGSISLAIQAPILDDGTLDRGAPLFQVSEYLEVLGIYQNSFVRSPPGPEGTRYSCSTDLTTLMDKENLELGICYPFNGEQVDLSGVIILANERQLETVEEAFAGSGLTVLSLPKDDQGREVGDFLHNLILVEHEDGQRVFVYSLGHASVARVSVIDVQAQESTLVCTADLPEDEALLSHGSVLLPRHDATIFGVYAAAEWMELRWFDVETCTEQGEMLPEVVDNKGTWMNPVDAEQLYATESSADVVVAEHHITYNTAGW